MANAGTGDATEEGTGRGKSYRLLNDQPAERIDGDLLGMTEIATGVASVLVASITSSPFVLAIDASWGMGKSTLLRQIEYQFCGKPGIVQLRFNAWTAEGENALEGLIKAVLGKLDRNVLRRWVRWLARQQSVVGIARLVFGLVARFFGVARLVDELWDRMAVDAKSRNELRDLINKMLTDWISREGKRDPERALVVFIDDLDRCSDEVVVKVCEAVKLYLDAPGLIFVIACDQSVLARGVSLSPRGETSEGRAYLEKIVQVAYRMPPPEGDQIKELIRVYAQESGTAELFNETVTNILAEGTSRNPRRIKRIINSFVLEHRLDPAWRQPPLGSWLLITAVLLQHLYTSFYELLVSEHSGVNPIGEFLDYVHVREKVPEAPADSDDPYWETVRRSCKAHRLQLPEEPPIHIEKLTVMLELLEHELPEGFPTLARNSAFIALMRGIEEADAGDAFRAQLIRRPLVTASDHDLTPARPLGALAGWRIVCVDDNPHSLAVLVQMLEDLGASVKVHSGPAGADPEIRRWKPHAVISDIARGDDPAAGFTHVSQLRESGYDGPVVFFTARVTPERRRRAEELGALDVVTSERAVIDSLAPPMLTAYHRDVPDGPHRLHWEREETVLACDLVAQNGWRQLDASDPRVQELSGLLQRMSLHPLQARLPSFRNAASVARKTYNIATVHPDYVGPPSNANKLDKRVLDEFLDDPEQMHRYAQRLRQAAERDELLRQPAAVPGRLVFCVGTESSLFTRGIVPGRSVGQRVANIRTAACDPAAMPGRSRRSSPKRASGFARCSTARSPMPRPRSRWSTGARSTSSASTTTGTRGSRTIATPRRSRRYLGQGKPVVNSEFGHSPYRGDRPGHMEFGEVDTGSVALHRIPLAGRLVRTRLKRGSRLRDEGHQARELTKTLGILAAEGADGAFVWTFADPWLTHSADPRYDLDMTATSLVKTYARGHGSTYPGMPWEPKQAFSAVATFYTARLALPGHAPDPFGSLSRDVPVPRVRPEAVAGPFTCGSGQALVDRLRVVAGDLVVEPGAGQRKDVNGGGRGMLSAWARGGLANPHIGRLPLETAIDQFYAANVFMHTWDLSRATGQDDWLDPDFCAQLLGGMEQMEQVIRSSGQYGARVEVPGGADTQTRLLGFIGRDPFWPGR